MFTVSGQRLLIMLLVSYQLVFQRCGDQFVGELEMGACNSSPIESQIIGERVRLGSFAGGAAEMAIAASRSWT